MIVGIVGSIISLCLGWYGRDLIERCIRGLRLRRAALRSAILHGDDVRGWLIQYYRDDVNHVFNVRIGDEAKDIPFLSKPIWSGGVVETSGFLNYIRTSECDVPTDMRAVAYRRKLGLRLWNAPLLCLENMRETDGGVVINVVRGDYFQYLSRCGRIEDEAIRIVAGNGRRRPRERDRLAPDLPRLADGVLGAQGIGVQALVAWKTSEGHKVLLQHRSSSLCTAGGYVAPVPCFGCVPPDNIREPSDILLYNFLKEFYEELYDQEDLIRDGGHAQDDWFYEQEPISTVLKLKRKGEFSLNVVGFGFDALTGEVNIALLASFENDDFIEQEMRRMKYNWEVKRVFSVSINSPELEHLLRDGKLLPSGSFNLTNSIRILANGDGASKRVRPPTRPNPGVSRRRRRRR